MKSCGRCGLESDYVPKGGGNARHPVNPRVPGEDEFWRCGAVVGEDIQSGPFYCGDRATLVADEKGEPGVVVAVCKRHEYDLKKLIGRRESEERKRLEDAERCEANCDLWDAH